MGLQEGLKYTCTSSSLDAFSKAEIKKASKKHFFFFFFRDMFQALVTAQSRAEVKNHFHCLKCLSENTSSEF